MIQDDKKFTESPTITIDYTYYFKMRACRHKTCFE